MLCHAMSCYVMLLFHSAIVHAVCLPCDHAEYVKRFAKKTDAEELSAKDGSDGTESDGFLSSSDDEEDLPASGGGGGMAT